MTTALTAFSTTIAQGESPSINLYGATGLIDMPSGEAQPDGYLSGSTSYFGPISRTTLSFQITSRLSGSFRYTGIRKWDDFRPSDFSTFYDRSFDLRYQVFKEGQYVPAVTVGFQDFVGTGILAGEYVAATKNILPGLKITAGLGWGRLGSRGSIGSPFGDRGAINIGQGGKFNFDQWFRGPVAPFGGVEWAVDDKWTLKAEYSSDNYDTEAGARRTFDHKSPFNFGVEYAVADAVRLGAYYMYGSEVGIAAHFLINPAQRPTGSIGGPAPDPVKPRPVRSADPDAWSPEWISQPQVAEVLISNLNKRLADDDIIVEALGFTGDTAQVRMRNVSFDAEAQAVGRLARAMSQSLPASIEVFEIVPVVNGVPAAKVTLRRSDIEALEFAPDAASAIRSRTRIGDSGPAMANLTFDPEIYPKFTWSLAPQLRTSLFDPEAPIRADLGLRLAGRYDLVPGVVLSGAVAKRLFGSLDQSDRTSNSVLPHVRSDTNRYDSQGDPSVETLTAAWYSHPGKDLYGRVTVGYLERMFGGVSTELLWRPISSRFALGAEVNYAKQRDFNQLFGFQDYDILTGHVSAYYKFAAGFHGQLDVGRYLAGDKGATLSLEREFTNGWRVGAFATITDVSAADFGEGSFDKGIRLEIPLNWFMGKPTRRTALATIRPLTRDGGARLEVEGRLYETFSDYNASGFDEQWARFWK
ncbi:MAG: YjbH domain-containing protein [Paracoccaceae bacterium]|nr:YjbH domain-containing protein [Paracoccaceae bacterium]